MDAYANLLEKTRIPQPSFQKLAVISIFEKLRSAPPHLSPDSGPGTEAITQCLHSASPAVVDQSVRELCRLVRDSKMELSRGLMELQSALEGTDSRFVNLFVNGLGFLVRLGFRNNPHSFQFQSSETHPFVMILSSRKEVQAELVRQVLIFIAEYKQQGMEEVCQFLTPFLNYAIVRMSSLVLPTSFARGLLSSIASLCCSFPREAIPIIELLVGRIKYFPCKNEDDYAEIFYFVECTVDAFSVVLRQLVGMGLLVHEAQLCSVELLDAIFSLHNDILKPVGSVEYILEVSRRLLAVQNEFGLSFLPELSSVISFMFTILVHSELEHEQLSAVKLLCSILRWKNDSGKNVHRSGGLFTEELLFIFPVINLVYSPSKAVKKAAIDLLTVLRKLAIDLLISPTIEVSAERELPPIITSAHISVRLLQSLWLQEQSSLPGVFYLNFAFRIESSVEKHNKAKLWTSMASEYVLQSISRRKSSLSVSGSHENLHTEMHSLLSGIACVLLTHRTLGHSAGDLLAICSKMEPKLGVPLLLVILFYNHIFSDSKKNFDFDGMQLKLLGMLPSLSSHPAMLPLVVQTVLPMLQRDAKPVLYATAIRLICKTWECNDRIFGSLQGVLLANKFTEFASDREVLISMAISVRDVCRKDPDRGVDLILSVAACIEHQDSLIQSLGLESLAHLCEADVIDFYTAWDVIAKHVLNYFGNAAFACSLCRLLRWGAMDAEAYPEAAIEVVKLLWEIGTSAIVGHGWSKARASAFVALTHYEVGQLQKCLSDFNDRNLEFLASETDPEVLGALEAFEVKIINHEHITRRRLVKQKQQPKSKIEKLLDVFPQVIFPSGKDRRARELPGAALFSLSFTLKGLNMPGASETLQDVQGRYKNAVVEIADSLQLSRNILIALLALQSWKPFLQRWIRTHIMLLDTKGHSTVLDKTSIAAKEILKSLIQIAEKSSPRSAENIALAIGALRLVLPLSDHAIKSTASKFLLSWLYQHEHEYRQWCAAISLGLISSCLHVTDHKLKIEYINALLEVLSLSKSTLVKGACGVGLGFSCQDLLTKSDAEDDFKRTRRVEELDLLKKIIGSLSQLISPLTNSSSDILKNVFSCLQLVSDDFCSNITPEFFGQTTDDFEEDVWGVAGLILGLGSSIGAIYRAGFYDAVLNLKSLLISWISNLNPSIPFPTDSAKSDLLFSVGASLAAPMVMAFCHRVELVDGNEMDRVVACYKHLITELASFKKSNTFHQSLMMASCVGAGNLIGTITNGGLHSLKIDDVKDFLALFRKCYSDPNSPYIHLGAMIGAVNSLGASAGTLIQDHRSSSLSHAINSQKESLYINGPLLSSSALEPDLTSLVQEIFLVAQKTETDRLQQYAAWAVSFLRHSSHQEPHYKETTTASDVGMKNVSQSFSEDSTVLKLSLWLMHLDYPGTGDISHVNTISMVLHCLTHAPRLPSVDWAAIIRRLMRYEDQAAASLSQDVTFKKGHLREECLLFSLSHASQFDDLLIFLDELCDLARMRTLELGLQTCILSHLADLTKIFSGSRLVKLFNDVADFFSWLVSSGLYSPEQKSSLRFSCCRGLSLCLDESSLDTESYKSEVENCMKLIFNFLPEFPSAGSKELYQTNILEEWSEAVRCLGKSPQEWLLDLLQVSEANLTNGNYQFDSVKKIQMKSRLVQNGSIPLSELGKLKAYMLNCRCEVIWDALLGVIETLQHTDGSAKRQWLVNAMEISCVSCFPSTALRFIGLLCGSCCRYMPLLIVDQMTVLGDLPVTLASLLSDSNWAVVAEPVVSHLWSLTLRVYNWEKHTTGGDYPPNQPPIDSSENDMATFLFQVLHQTCISLKEYLPPKKLLRLANMVIN